MKKIILLILLNFLFYNTAFAESYYFKKCLLNETVSANYLINIEEKFINVIFESSDGKIQKVTDGIELIEKNKIISKKIKSSKSDDSYFIYYLDASSDSVIKQNYERQKIGEINLVKPVGEKIISKCKEVKADWDEVKKIEIIKKQRKNGQPTVPTTIRDELDCNIFLRAKDIKTFSKLRDLKDNF